MHNFTIYKALLAVLMVMVAGQAQSALHQFNLQYSGSEFDNLASAVGLLTMDDQITPNPTSEPSFLYFGEGQAILELDLTVNNATSGNGSFSLTDFDYVSWDTGGDSLDWSLQLIGQAVDNGGWGTATDGTVGDFGLWANANSNAPSASGFFVIKTNNGTGDALRLVSMRPVPVSGMVWLFAGSVLGLLKRRR